MVKSVKIDLSALDKRRRQYYVNDLKAQLAKERKCANSHCKSGLYAARNHQISESQLSEIAIDGKVVLSRPPVDLVALQNKVTLFKEHPIRRSLTFKALCSECDRTFFTDLDDTTTAFDHGLVLKQAYRGLRYQQYIDSTDFEARLNSFNKVGLISAIAPTAYIQDRRVAANAKEEAAYMLDGHRHYLSLLEPDRIEQHYFAVQSVRIKENPPFRLTSCSYLNPGFYGEVLGLDWNNSGSVQPKIFWFLQRYSGETHLAWAVRSRFESFAEEIRNQIIELSPQELFFQVFRYACLSNLGFAVAPDYYRWLRKTCRSSVNEIERVHKKVLRTQKSGKNWQTWKYPECLGELSIV